MITDSIYRPARLDRPESGNIGYALVRTFLGFCFYFDLDFLNGVQNSTALHAQIYLITNLKKSEGCRRQLC